MKRIISLLLSILIVLSSLLCMISCDLDGIDSGRDDDAAEENDKNKTEEKEETEKTEENETTKAEAPEAPEGYKLYTNGAIQFAYPENWVLTDGSIVIISEPSGVGANITVSYEAYSDLYTKMDEASFGETLLPQLEASGMSVSNLSVSQKETNGAPVTEITYTAVVVGISMTQTLYIIAANNYNYAITVTELESVTNIADTVFSTLAVVSE